MFVAFHRTLTAVRRSWSPTCALVPLVLLAACALPIERAASDIATPVRYVTDTTPDAGEVVDATWWRHFGSPELDRLMAAAMAGNFDVAAAIARLRQADAQLRIANAQLLPFVEGRGSVGRVRTGGNNPGTPGVAVDRYGGSVAARYEIDFWGKLRAQQQAARDTVTAFGFAIGTVTLTTQASIASTLFDLIGAGELLRIQQANLAIAERTLDILRQRLAVGTATGLDVAQQEAIVAQTRAQVPPLRQTIAADTFALATLAGMRPEDITVAPQALTDLRVPEIAPGLPSELLARRPDVRAAEAGLAAANADVTAARGALFPTIALTAEGGIQSAALDILLRPGSSFYNLALGVTRPLFDGGALRAQLDQARGRQEELLAEYRRSILAALQDTETNLSALQRSAELVRLQRAREAAANRAYSIADSQFRAGTIDLLNLLVAQTTLFNARIDLAQAQVSQLQAAAALFTALGGGWTMEAVRLAEASRTGTPR
jgi:NodT family efflux transporter outer membrane factor (OMF) lipoprotein